MKKVKGINLSDELWEWLQAKAERAQRSVSNLIEVLLSKEMEKDKKQN